MKDQIIIFCDGSSRGNPGPGGWGAIVSENGTITEIGGGEKFTTNNKMELEGAIHALRLVKDAKKEIILHTDSTYVVKGMTEWISGWQKKNWRTSAKKAVLNRELWEELAAVSQGKKITWQYVAGHAGIPGNERCDEIATSFADGEKIELFSGNINSYQVKIFDI